MISARADSLFDRGIKSTMSTMRFATPDRRSLSKARKGGLEMAAGRSRPRFAALFGLTALSGLVGAAQTAVAATGAIAPAAESTAASGAADAADSGTAIEEVVVTARHRSENLQSVPVSVSALGADILKRTNTSNIAQIALLVPSLTFTFFNARNANLNIRGLGNNVGLANDGIEPGVGFYVDQVYYNRPATATFDLIDVSQVEVLNGPQGTLFGKNSTAGAVTVATEAPTFTPEVTGGLSGGNLGYFQGWGAVSGPIVDDRLAGRLTFATTTREGLLTNTTHDGEVNDYRNLNVRAQLLWTPTTNFKMRLIGDYSNQKTNCCDEVLSGIVSPPNGKNFVTLAESFGYTPIVDPFNRRSVSNSPIHANQETGGVSAEEDWSLSKFVVTSISSWRFWNWWPANDADYTPLSVLTVAQNEDFQQQYSQELRIASAGANRIDYVGGLFAFYEHVKALGETQYGDAATAFLLSPALPSLVADGYTLHTFPTYNTTSLAAFGQATWHVTSRWNLTGGLRYTYDIKDGTFAQVASGGVPLTGPLAVFQPLRNALGTSDAFSVSVDKGDISGMADISFQAAPDVMTYLTFSQGFKSGGLNLAQLPPGIPSVIAPESIELFEGGVKSTLFDHRVTLNADIFFEDDTNYQANLINTQLFKLYLSNIPKVQSQGVEADMHAQPVDGLTLYTSAIYDRAIYALYPNAPCGIENITQPFCNLNGAPLAGVPRWSVSAGGEYSHTVSFGPKQTSIYAGLDYTYHSSLYSASTDSIYSKLPGLSLLNVRAGLRAADSAWDLYFWAKNVFNKNYLTFVGSAPGNTGALYSQLGDPRTYGVTFRFHY
jgi:iron complex outermembrane recepter protein